MSLLVAAALCCCCCSLTAIAQPVHRPVPPPGPDSIDALCQDLTKAGTVLDGLTTDLTRRDDLLLLPIQPVIDGVNECKALIGECRRKFKDLELLLLLAVERLPDFDLTDSDEDDDDPRSAATLDELRRLWRTESGRASSRPRPDRIDPRLAEIDTIDEVSTTIDSSSDSDDEPSTPRGLYGYRPYSLPGKFSN